MMKKELRGVRWHMTRLERHITSHRCIGEELKRIGRNSQSSEKRLAALLELQIVSKADRDRLQKLLAEADNPHA